MSYIQIKTENGSVFGMISTQNQTSITAFVMVDRYMEKVTIKKQNVDEYVLLTQEEYKESAKPTITQEEKNSSKMGKCMDIYKAMLAENNNTHPKRGEVIKRFMADVEMSDNCAATYYQTIKTKLAA